MLAKRHLASLSSLRSDGSPFGDQIIINAYILPYDRLSGICNAALNIIEFVIQ